MNQLISTLPQIGQAVIIYVDGIGTSWKLEGFISEVNADEQTIKARFDDVDSHEAWHFVDWSFDQIVTVH